MHSKSRAFLDLSFSRKGGCLSLLVVVLFVGLILPAPVMGSCGESSAGGACSGQDSKSCEREGAPSPQGRDCKEKDCKFCNRGCERVIDARDTFKDPVQLMGPAGICVTNVNVLRYAVTISHDTDVSDAPDLSPIGLIPGLKAAKKAVESTSAETKAKVEAGAAAASMDRGTATGDPSGQKKGFKARCDVEPVEGEFKLFAAEFQRLAQEVSQQVSEGENAAKAKKGVLDAIEELVEQSDTILGQEKGADDLSRAAGKQAERAKKALSRKVPRVTDLLGKIESALRSLNRFSKKRECFSEWYRLGENEKRFEGVLEGVQGLAEKLKPLGPEGKLRKQVVNLDAALSAWKTVLASLKPESFTVRRCQPCDFPFLRKREYAISLTKRDRLETDPKKVFAPVEIARITCLPSLVPSAGISIGGVDERRFGVIQGRAEMEGDGGEVELQRQIGVEAESSEDLAVLALINARLGTWGEDRRYAWYLSGGTQVNLGDSLEGDRIGYVLGVSMSFWRSFFVTLGVEGKRVRSLTGGFEIGDPAPMNLTQPPVVKEWQLDGFFGVTIGL